MLLIHQDSVDFSHAKAELFQSFAQWLKNNHIAPLTTASYLRSVRFFCQFLSFYHEKDIGIEDIVNVTMTDIRAFLAYRSGENIGNASNAQSLSALKTFYRFLVERGHTLSWNLQKLRRPRLPRTLPRPLDTDQLKPLLAPPIDPNAHWVEWRNYSIIVLLYATGLRIQEVLNMDHQHWGNPDGVRVLCKGGTERLVPILPIAQQAVESYLRKSPWTDRHPQTPVFLGEKGKRLQAGIVQKALRVLRITYHLPEHTTPHSFRHSFASHVLDGGACLRDVQELLGHKSVRATQVYTQTTQTRLQELYQRAHPGMKK